MTQFTTVEQLRMCVAGTVIRDAEEYVLEAADSYSTPTLPMQRVWLMTGSEEHLTSGQILLPATVLFTPSA